MNKSAILLSGGMDSIALCYWKRPDIAFTINYGQKPATAEIYAASRVADSLGIEHHVLEANCRSLGSGDLANDEQLRISPSQEWWPFRNQLLITLASMRAIKIDVGQIMLGSIKSDSFHQDGTDQFYKLINSLTMYQEGAIEIVAPALQYSTVELIKKSKIPSNILLWAHSCHTSNLPCSKCRGCQKYLLTLQEMGIENG